MLVSQNGLSRLHHQLQATVHGVLLLFLRSEKQYLRLETNLIEMYRVDIIDAPPFEIIDCSLWPRSKTEVHAFGVRH
jgi:hypothetical protein